MRPRILEIDPSISSNPKSRFSKGIENTKRIQTSSSIQEAIGDTAGVEQSFVQPANIINHVLFEVGLPLLWVDQYVNDIDSRLEGTQRGGGLPVRGMLVVRVPALHVPHTCLIISFEFDVHPVAKCRVA